jgi:hypothetical protein
VAFIDEETVDQEEDKALGRKYLLTLQQLICVARGENGMRSDESIDKEKILQVIRSGNPADIRRDKETGKYGLLLSCGEQDGLSVVTLTSPHHLAPETPPAQCYFATIWKGLRETYPSLSDTQIRDRFVNSLLQVNYPSKFDIDKYLEYSANSTTDAVSSPPSSLTTTTTNTKISGVTNDHSILLKMTSRLCRLLLYCTLHGA